MNIVKAQIATVRNGKFGESNKLNRTSVVNRRGRKKSRLRHADRQGQISFNRAIIDFSRIAIKARRDVHCDRLCRMIGTHIIHPCCQLCQWRT